MLARYEFIILNSVAVRLNKSVVLVNEPIISSVLILFLYHPTSISRMYPPLLFEIPPNYSHIKHHIDN